MKYHEEYVIWRYGNGWRTPNSNWRLNDGEMVILNNLKKYWAYYTNSKYYHWSKLKAKYKKNKNSIFYFSKKELKNIRKSKIKI